MDMDYGVPAGTWLTSFRQYARDYPLAAIGLVISLLAVLGLLLQSLLTVTQGPTGRFVLYALAGGTAGFVGTAVGALPIGVLRGVRQRSEDIMLGFSAGMMLAAASFSLLLPGLEAGTSIGGSQVMGALLVVVGMGLGVALMLGLDTFTPHEHSKTGPCGPGHERCGRIWLFVMAIALHNLPEGMAIGVGFSQGDLSIGLPLTAAIALQDIPEGLAVALTLRAVGASTGFAVLVAAGSGLLEPLGALIGVGLASGLAAAYPIGLGLAAGAMLFVVSHEVIPETHRNGHQTVATIGLMFGFAVMMVLDTTLG